MINLLFLFIICVCLGVLASIIWRKKEQLSNLTVEDLPDEQVSKKKKEIIYNRIKENNRARLARWQIRLAPLKKLWGKAQLQFRIYVGQIEKLLHYEQMKKTKEAQKTLSLEEKAAQISSFIKEGENHLQMSMFEKAEESFIAAIKLDAKAVEAYRGLGDAYLAKGATEEAQQTYEFLSQLEPYNDAVLVKLGELAEQKNDIEKAIEYYQRAVVLNDSLSPRFAHLADLLLRVGEVEVAKEAIIQAVELEPQNPKYLDFLLETAIMSKDKKMAEQAYNSLRLVNPDNQKLTDFRARILAI